MQVLHNGTRQKTAQHDAQGRSACMGAPCLAHRRRQACTRPQGCWARSCLSLGRQLARAVFCLCPLSFWAFRRSLRGCALFPSDNLALRWVATPSEQERSEMHRSLCCSAARCLIRAVWRRPCSTLAARRKQREGVEGVEDGGVVVWDAARRANISETHCRPPFRVRRAGVCGGSEKGRKGSRKRKEKEEEKEKKRKSHQVAGPALLPPPWHGWPFGRRASKKKAQVEQRQTACQTAHPNNERNMQITAARRPVQDSPPFQRLPSEIGLPAFAGQPRLPLLSLVPGRPSRLPYSPLAPLRRAVGDLRTAGADMGSRTGGEPSAVSRLVSVFCLLSFSSFVFCLFVFFVFCPSLFPPLPSSTNVPAASHMTRGRRSEAGVLVLGQVPSV